ncbi:hypothetical protein ACJ73_08337, partial [Blastomyces percursus]
EGKHWVSVGLGKHYQYCLSKRSWVPPNLTSASTPPRSNRHIIPDTGVLVQAKAHFLLFHDMFTRMHDLRHDLSRSALLLQLLIHLFLRAFRKEVFDTLASRTTRQPLQPQALKAACAGDLPLTLQGFTRVFLDAHFREELQFVTGLKMRVTNIKLLFAWLWGLASLNGGLTPADLEEDSDPESLKATRARKSHQLVKMQQRLQVARKECQRYIKNKYDMKRLQEVQQDHRTLAARIQPGVEKEAHTLRLRRAQEQYQKAADKLSRVSQQATRRYLE